ADYAQAVAWAVKEGVTAGLSADTFGPDNICTRAQIVTFLKAALD
ncbi:MAG: S-layer homology domain-containing protein, partial [Firmicutes bacterium]|nr:S-layer homology domain-containing protein [Bacillota bacterium]